MQKIGFMQGRLSPVVNGKIQSFPWETWRDEFNIAAQNEYPLIEWTIDYDAIEINPIMSQAGRKEILKLITETGVSVESVTGDCFMQAPFWRADSIEVQERLKKLFLNVVYSCADLGVKYLVVPLVDNGSLVDKSTEIRFIENMHYVEGLLSRLDIKICLESDYSPSDLMELISQFDLNIFGVNYDIGNSASAGIDPKQEICLLQKRIYNVHVKDRLLNGATVPLGEGNANFDEVFQLLNKVNYKGNFILQTARAKDDKHLDVLNTYRQQVFNWLSRCN